MVAVVKSFLLPEMDVKDPQHFLHHLSSSALRGCGELHVGESENPLNFGTGFAKSTTSSKSQIRLLYGSREEHVLLEFGGDTSLLEEGKRAFLTSNCVAIRSAAVVAFQHQIVSICDCFIRSNFTKMMNEREILSLPRLQVRVKVANHLHSLWIKDATNFLDDVLLAVVRQLKDLSTSRRMKGVAMEENTIEVMMSHSSLEETYAANDKYNSPEKPNTCFACLHGKDPSPARKLDLGHSQDSDSDGDDGGCKGACVNKWNIVARKSLSGNAAMCVVSSDLPKESLLTLNVQLFSEEYPSGVCPVSPTTGVPQLSGSALISQMSHACCGFGAVGIEDDSTIMCVGGFNRTGVSSHVERFDISANSWYQANRLTTKRARMAAVKANNTLYAIGGSDGKKELSSMEELDLSQSDSDWKTMAPTLCVARSDFGATVLGDKVYVVGGTHYSMVLKSVEAFDTRERKWKPVASMNVPRKGASVVSCNGKIFALGGQQSSWICLNSVECYDPYTNQWTQVAPMATPRRNAAVVTVEDLIYVMGGYSGSKAVQDMEVYDPISNTWSTSTPMTTGRSGASAVMANGDIYVLGGYSGRSFLNTVEKYSIDSNQWTSFTL